MTTVVDGAATGVGVGVAVGVGVGVGVGLGVGDGVAVGDGEGVGEVVGVGLGVGAGLGVGLGVGEGVLHESKGEAELRGLAAPVAKSAALSLVSVQPLAFLRAAVVLFEGALAGALPSKQVAVVP